MVKFRRRKSLLMKTSLQVQKMDKVHHCKVSNSGQSFRYQKEFGRNTVNVHGQVQKTEEFINEDSDEDSE